MMTSNDGYYEWVNGYEMKGERFRWAERAET